MSTEKLYSMSYALDSGEELHLIFFENYIAISHYSQLGDKILMTRVHADHTSTNSTIED